MKMPMKELLYERAWMSMKVYESVSKCINVYESVVQLPIYGSNVSSYPYKESALYVG